MRGFSELTILKEINNIENARCKYFIIGFIISLIPYSFVLLITTHINVSKLFVYTIIAFTITSCLLNGIIVSNNIYNKLVLFFENKYNESYKKIKESIK